MLREPKRHQARGGSTLLFLPQLYAIPKLVAIVTLYFTLFFVFSGMEATLALWCDKVLDMGPQQVGYYLAFAGICGVIVQGWLVGKLAPKIGEARLVLVGLFTLTIGLAGLPYVPEPIWLLLPIALLSVGFGFANPSLQSLISRAAPQNLRGGTMGVAQSANSLGRILGPAWAGYAFIALGVAAPFLSGAALLIPVLVVTAILARRIKQHF